ncbi:MAG: polysaccharide biosynthesis C-terminal domain-containing protein [Saprospiraceae bacterium]
MELQLKYFFQLFARFLSQFFAFVVSVVIVRIAGVEVNGQYGAILAFLNLGFSVFASSIQTNYLRSGRANDFNIVTASTLVLCLISFPFICFAAFLLKYDIALLSIAVLQILLINLFNIFSALKRLQIRDIDIIIPGVLPYLVALIFLLSIKPQNAFSLLAIMSVSWSVIIPFLIKEWNLNISLFSIKKIKNYLIESSVIAGSIIFTQVFANADILFIKQFLGDTQAGLYRIATSFSSIVMPFIGIFSFTYLSEIQPLIDQNNLIAFKNKFRNQLIINITLGLTLFLFSIFVNPILIPFIYSQNATGAIDTSIALSVGVTTNVVAMVFSYTFLALKKERYLIPINGLAAFINVACNFLFIRYFGIIGGAISMIITFVFISMACIFLLKRWRIFNI